ncbi:hypothetical protein LUZ60_016651 [Juncus effusus]|nr:hypothetical protein LUZ60_016651 [Juncus effusus]
MESFLAINSHKTSQNKTTKPQLNSHTFTLHLICPFSTISLSLSLPLGTNRSSSISLCVVLRKMRRQRGGFKLGRKIVTLLKRTFGRCRRKPNYLRLKSNPLPPPDHKPALTTKLLHWTKSLKHLLINPPKDKSYTRLISYQPDCYKPPPKGHLAVYVAGDGKDGGSPRRFVVPVVYFNHPLFGELLKEAEEQFGFGQPGGITIPCPVAKFERVQTCIEAGAGRLIGCVVLVCLDLFLWFFCRVNWSFDLVGEKESAGIYQLE